MTRRSLLQFLSALPFVGRAKFKPERKTSYVVSSVQRGHLGGHRLRMDNSVIHWGRNSMTGISTWDEPEQFYEITVTEES